MGGSHRHHTCGVPGRWNPVVPVPVLSSLCHPTAESAGRVFLPRFGSSQSPQPGTPRTGWAWQLFLRGAGGGALGFFFLFSRKPASREVHHLLSDAKIGYRCPARASPCQLELISRPDGCCSVPAAPSRKDAKKIRMAGGIRFLAGDPPPWQVPSPSVPVPTVPVLTPRRAGMPRPARPAAPAAAATAPSRPRPSAGDKGTVTAWDDGATDTAPDASPGGSAPANGLWAELAPPGVGGVSPRCWGLEFPPPYPSATSGGTGLEPGHGA